MIASLQEFFALESRHPFGKMLLISLFFHFLIICVAVISPRVSSKKIHYPSIHRVNLVSFPAASPQMPGKPAGKKAESGTPPPVAKPKTPPPVAKSRTPPPAAQSKTLPSGTKPVAPVKASVSRTTKRASAPPKKKIKEKVERKVDTGAQISSALAEIRREVASRQEGARLGEGGLTGYGYGGSGKRTGGGVLDPESQAYYQLVRERIEENWILPDIVDRSRRNLKLTVCLRIGRDGRIIESWIDESSGLNYFDQSLLRAVKKTGSLPPPPKKIIGNYLCPKYGP